LLAAARPADLAARSRLAGAYYVTAVGLNLTDEAEMAISPARRRARLVRQSARDRTLVGEL
jgi:hypothetical protein